MSKLKMSACFLLGVGLRKMSARFPCQSRTWSFAVCGMGGTSRMRSDCQFSPSMSGCFSARMFPVRYLAFFVGMLLKQMALFVSVVSAVWVMSSVSAFSGVVVVMVFLNPDVMLDDSFWNGWYGLAWMFSVLG